MCETARGAAAKGKADDRPADAAEAHLLRIYSAVAPTSDQGIQHH
jgi:hypothetical protein